MYKLSLLACAVFIVGCGTATYKDPTGRELVVSLDKVNIQDFATAGSQMLQSMISSPSFAKGAPVLQLGSITNDTADNFDTALLLSKLTVPLVNAGRVTLLDNDATANAARAAAGSMPMSLAPNMCSRVRSSKTAPTLAAPGRAPSSSS